MEKTFLRMAWLVVVEEKDFRVGIVEGSVFDDSDSTKSECYFIDANREVHKVLRNKGHGYPELFFIKDSAQKYYDKLRREKITYYENEIEFMRDHIKTLSCDPFLEVIEENETSND